MLSSQQASRKDRKNMLKQQGATANQKSNQLPLWKRMTVVTAILFSGGSLATLVPGQAVYAHNNRSNTSHHIRGKERKENINLIIRCKAGNGGKGGLSTKKSNGAAGGAGGNCNITIPLNIFLAKQNNKGQKTSASSPEANHDGSQRPDNSTAY